jgi:hypothetical protein
VVAVAVPGGGYAAVVGVTAELTGVIGNRPAGTSLTAVTAVTYQTAVYLATDTAGGADAESDAALLARLPSATAPRTVASNAGAVAVVTDAVPGITAVAVGFGHEGMRRGRSALTGQTPGRMDLRVRTSDAPSRERVAVTATLVGTSPYGQWRFTLGVDDAPGRFRVEKVLQTNAALSIVGYTPSTLSPGYDLTDDEVGLDVRSADDAALSRYATLTVTFSDPDTSTGGMTVNVTTRAYDAIVRVVPGLGDAQTACDDTGARAAGGDCLVRAAVPVMTTVTAVATVAAGVTLTAAQVRTAVAAAINGNGIDTALATSAVAARAAALLPTGTALSLTDWAGTIYAVSPTASAAATSSANGLSVATDWANGVGPDAVAYYADAEGVTASVVTV